MYVVTLMCKVPLPLFLKLINHNPSNISQILIMAGYGWWRMGLYPSFVGLRLAGYFLVLITGWVDYFLGMFLGHTGYQYQILWGCQVTYKISVRTDGHA
jgi:hypothetical protein